ncbi:MAG: hypothetical protein Salg2KO_23080 [Salibacteraceae bacterium]
MDVYLQCVCDAWDALSPDSIRVSFKVCGITIATDESEDNLVHCFKPHGPIPEGFVALREKSGIIVSQHVDVPGNHHDELEGQVMEVVELERTPQAGGNGIASIDIVTDDEAVWSEID